MGPVRSTPIMLSAELTELVLYTAHERFAHGDTVHWDAGEEVLSAPRRHGHGGAGHARRSAQAPPLPPQATPTAWRPSSSALRQAAPLTAALLAAGLSTTANRCIHHHLSTSRRVVINFVLRKRNELVIKIVISFHFVITLL